MKYTARLAVLAVLTSVALSVAGSTTPSLHGSSSSSLAGRDGGAASAPHAGDAARWLKATQAALDDPTPVQLPFAELRELAGLSADAAAFSFDALSGQVLEVTLATNGAGDERGMFVEVFRVVDVLGHALHERLTALRPGAASFKTRLPSDGTYHVLVQNVATRAGYYRLTLELSAALLFPVAEGEEDAIRSLFGASRDAGRRHHEGVDIFAQRFTPVLAVTAGRVMPRQDPLGGNTVWLNTPGTSYYYAHLDRVAVKEQQFVKAGDVLGYVGNTGNARRMPSHLHFGVYRWGRDPIDPLPLLVERRFAERDAAAGAANAGG